MSARTHTPRYFPIKPFDKLVYESSNLTVKFVNEKCDDKHTAHIEIQPQK